LRKLYLKNEKQPSSKFMHAFRKSNICG